MPIPHFSQIKTEIMDRLQQLGGQAETAEIHDYFVRKWQLTPQEQSWRDSAGGIHYKKQIDGAIAHLTMSGQIVHPRRGLLQLTAKTENLTRTITRKKATM